MSLRIIFGALFAAPLLFLAVPCPAAYAQSNQAGFERVIIADGTEVGVWYPAAGTPSHQRLGPFAQEVVAGSTVPDGHHPLIVISHGTGGNFSGHLDTAVALARAGFVVAALTHPGDNFRDNSRATYIEDRPKALNGLITYMLTAWRSHNAIDPDRIGAFGFSAGGFTVLAAAGGRPDLTRLAGHCAAHPRFFDCTLLKSKSRVAAPAWPDLRDARIKAIVVAAPALGFAFDRAGLAAIRIPVQLWRADKDMILPAPFYTDAVRAALPIEPEFHTVADAGHFDFIAPCADSSGPAIPCTSQPGFDRAAFHVRLDEEVVRFFRTKLGD